MQKDKLSMKPAASLDNSNDFLEEVQQKIGLLHVHEKQIAFDLITTPLVSAHRTHSMIIDVFYLPDMPTTRSFEHCRTIMVLEG